MNYRKKARADALKRYHRQLASIDKLMPVMDIAKRLASEWKLFKPERRVCLSYTVSYPLIGHVYLGLYLAGSDLFLKDVAILLDGFDYEVTDQSSGKRYEVKINGWQSLDVYAYVYESASCHQVQVGTQPVYEWKCND